MSNGERRPSMTITPEPSPEELAAIVAAVTAAMRAQEAAAMATPSPPPETSRWARAGRLEAVRRLGEADDW